VTSGMVSVGYQNIKKKAMGDGKKAPNPSKKPHPVGKLRLPTVLLNGRDEAVLQHQKSASTKKKWGRPVEKNDGRTSAEFRGRSMLPARTRDRELKRI